MEEQFSADFSVTLAWSYNAQWMETHCCRVLRQSLFAVAWKPDHKICDSLAIKTASIFVPTP